MFRRRDEKLPLQKLKDGDITETCKRQLQAGMQLANGSLGEEVVITGMSGRFPNSDSVYEFRDHLFNKVDMVSSDEDRWGSNNPEIPPRSGKIRSLEKFDAGFFGVHYNQATAMDPVSRLLLECTYEAILDAGVHPQQLKGSRTGVFIGNACFGPDKSRIFGKFPSPGLLFTSSLFRDAVEKLIILNPRYTNSMQAQWISYFLLLEGPAYVIDSGCSSSQHALEHAYKAIRTGRCDNAIVGGTNLCLNPFVTLDLIKLGALSCDGYCRAFDADSSGYVRSETVAAVFLQKAKGSKRIYAQVVHIKTNSNGYNEKGIIHPSTTMQKQLLEEVFQESNVEPADVVFQEFHATGTQTGDLQEIMAVEEAICAKRQTPLYVGSVKANMGHAEGASGLCSLIKVLLNMENDCLLPNISYQNPKEAKALKNGAIEVVTEKLPWSKDSLGFAGVSNFGLGGSNAYVLLKRFTKSKTKNVHPMSNLPYLISVSGRTENSIKHIFESLNNTTINNEFSRLLHEVFSADIAGHSYRGYIIMSKRGELRRSLTFFDGTRKPLCLMFGTQCNKLLSIAKQFLLIPTFSTSIQKIYKILLQKNINLMDIINQKDLIVNVKNTIIATVSVEIAIIDALSAIELEPDYVIGCATGELLCAYVDGALTLKQTVLAAYYASLHLQSSKSAEDIENENVQKLLKYLVTLIPQPKTRSTKWLTTKSGDYLTSNLVQYASAEYFVRKFMDPVQSDDLILLLPPASTILYVGGEFRSSSNLNTVCFTPEVYFNNNMINPFLYVLGEMYKLGYNLKLERLYPKLEWPVSSGTPMISPLIKWNQENDWFVPFFKIHNRRRLGEHTITFNVKKGRWAFMTGHVIDGRNLVPAAGYIIMVWEAYATTLQLKMSDMRVVFEDVKFYRAIDMAKHEVVELTITLQMNTRKFEIENGSHTVCTGKVSISLDFPKETAQRSASRAVIDAILLKKEDVYKELKLRGYSYTGAFRGIEECDLSASMGCIKWTNNWITFVDCMLQLKLLQEDTRELCVITCIEHLTIDAKAHIDSLQTFEDALVPVYVEKQLHLVRSGAIEIRGLVTKTIPRRKLHIEPILEKYVFVPFQAKLLTEEAVRVNIQILLENINSTRVQIVEVEEGNGQHGRTPLAPIVHLILDEHSLIKSKIVVLSKNSMELTGVSIEDKELPDLDKTVSMIIASNVLEKTKVLEQALAVLQKGGLIMSRENLASDLATTEKFFAKLDILTVYETPTERLVLLKHASKPATFRIIEVGNTLESLDWLAVLQSFVKIKEDILLLAQNKPLSGIVGFYNCLKRELVTSNIKSVFVKDPVPKFDIKDQVYLKQLQKGLAVNVLQDGKWGTYRHLPFKKAATIRCEHMFNSVIGRGDLSSLTWIQGPLTNKTVLSPGELLVYVYCAALNFRDIMTASDRINSKIGTKYSPRKYTAQGYEFSGREACGRRVMGMINGGALANMVAADSQLTWEIPEKWSMEEAATVPLVYSTVLYSFVTVAEIKTGQSILIHAGAGGVGQAAINVALHHRCEIFTTVGTQEKRDFIKKQFPEIPESHIGNTRDTSFEQMVLRGTKGRGVDVVLNSLSEEKLQASLRCLAAGGKFLEIGRFDLESNNAIPLQTFRRGCSFHGVMLDAILDGSTLVKSNVTNLVARGIKSGYVKPLITTIFVKDEVEDAYRYMSAGKHIGKIVIRLRQEDVQKEITPRIQLCDAKPRLYCCPDSSYVVVGGLGGFGLELADWLVRRGARNLLLASRHGLKTGYQASRIQIWKSHGVVIKVSTVDLTVEEGCVTLLSEASKLGPVKGIFNLAVVLKDAFFENQTEDKFAACLASKAVVTQYLDTVSRIMCPNLQSFVVFSSVVCGKGNVGQTNYGMANSIMERICERRKSEGYPALAIQWGAIADVGLVASMQNSVQKSGICGTQPQTTTSCFEVMDAFLQQDEVVVSSTVLTQKESKTERTENLVKTVKRFMGIRDLKTTSPYFTLPELGLDSVTASEIKQVLEIEHGVFLTTQEIRRMTFARLYEIAHKITTECVYKQSDSAEGRDLRRDTSLRLLIVREDHKYPEGPLVQLPSLVASKTVASKIFLLPGITGDPSTLEALASNLKFYSLCLQYTFNDHSESTVEDLAKSMFPHVLQNLPEEKSFTIVAHSFGCIIALELVSLLESKGHVGRAILIDGDPESSKRILKQLVPENGPEALLQTNLLCSLMEVHIPSEIILKHKGEIFSCETLEKRIAMAVEITHGKTKHSRQCQRNIYMGLYTRLRSVLTYTPTLNKLKSTVELFKASQPILEDFDHDHGIQALCQYPVDVKVFQGNHLTMLRNLQLAHEINMVADTDSVRFEGHNFK